MAKPKKRTAATKPAVPEQQEEDARPIPTEKQEAEVEALRKTAEENKYTARLYLDALVAVCFFVTGRQVWRYHNNDEKPLIVGLTLIQTMLVPLSLSSHRLPVVGKAAAKNHPFVLTAQLTVFIILFCLMLGKMPFFDLIRAALPELLTICVDMQRRAENQNEAALAKLAGLTYAHKSA